MEQSTRRVGARDGILALSVALVLYGLFAHGSDEPYVMGYSLFYIGCLCLFAIGVVFTFVLFRRFKSKAWYAIAAIVLPFSIAAVLIEICAQVYALRNPSYEVLYVQPDRPTGWKLVPNFHFIWAGPHWAAFEFSTPVVTNSAGYRDLERTVEKPADVVRVALLGDSLIEALQVPFDRTAGQVLERSLNAGERSAAAGRAPRFEVLNFGVSAYGLGQYLLTWQHYARAYKPDYVFAYVARFHMIRTVSKGGMLTQGLQELSVRPTFRLQSNELVLEPAVHYEEFFAAQRKMIESQLGGQRIQKRAPGLFLRKLVDEVSTRVTRLQRDLMRRNVAPPSEFTAEVQAINMRILEELNKSVHESGARLILVDAIRSHGGSLELSESLKSLCAREGIGYANVSDDLLDKEHKGITTTRAYDGHFNEIGNEVLAAAMHRWMTTFQHENGHQN